MIKYILLNFLLIFSTSTVNAQLNETDAQAKAELKKLQFIVGSWSGTGWMMGNDGKKHEFQQTELVQFKLDSTAVLIEGLGKTGGQVIHDALAIISFNKQNNNYKFQSLLSSGRGGSFKAELIDDKLYWYPNDNMRYIIYLNEKEQWYEKGEIKRDNGWFQFMEMTLDKK